jgi:hypothetical protein
MARRVISTQQAQCAEVAVVVVTARTKSQAALIREMVVETGAAAELLQGQPLEEVALAGMQALAVVVVTAGLLALALTDLLVRMALAAQAVVVVVVLLNHHLQLRVEVEMAGEQAY